jgi:DNA-directed RNA polymerase specialized sigma24 family protein
LLGIDRGVTTAEAERVADSDSGESAGDSPRVVAIEPDGPVLRVARSFEDVYRASYQRMTRVAHLMTGSNEAAEEIVQDAFVALYPRFETVDDPDGYLYRSVVNGCRARFRRQQLRERLRPLRSVPYVAPPDFDETWGALAKITPRRRAAVVLRFYADLPLAEIAEVLGCTAGTVKSLIHRGLAQLKDVIEP